MDLPRELRDVVYEFALCVSGAVFIYSADPLRIRVKGKIIRVKNDGPSEPRPIESIISVSLLRSCRQVHAECCGVLYGHNVFRLYMNDAPFGRVYQTLVRHIIFTTDADHRIYGDDPETVGYWWRKRFWPNIVEKSMKLLEQFPDLETLTFPIQLNRNGQTWRPAFLASDQKTREQRVALAASWMTTKCPLENEQLRQCLHLEIMPASNISKEEWVGSSFAPEEEWDCNEFAEAFERMKLSSVLTTSHTNDHITESIGLGLSQLATTIVAIQEAGQS